jgi:hypothetical protein
MGARFARVGVTATIIAVPIISLVGASSPGVSQAASPPTQIVPSGTCNPLAPVATKTLSQTFPSLSGGEETLTYTENLYDSDGIEATQVLPPVGWSPSGASNAELTFFDVPTRPTLASAGSEQELAAETDAWNAEWQNTPSFVSGFCQPEDTGIYNGTIPSSNWSGLADLGDTFTKIYASHPIPGAAYSGCSGYSANTAWVGIGGINSAGSFTQYLIQLGSLNFEGTLNYFWEALSPTVQLSEQPIGIAIAVGDNANMSITYDSASQTVDFGIHDITQKVVWNSGAITELDGYNASGFYDGSSAEIVDERPEYDGDYLELAKYGTTDSWSNGTVTDASGTVTDIRNVSSHDGIDMSDAEGTPLSTPSDSGYPATGFEDTWNACGTIDVAP